MYHLREEAWFSSTLIFLPVISNNINYVIILFLIRWRSFKVHIEHTLNIFFSLLICARKNIVFISQESQWLYLIPVQSILSKSSGTECKSNQYGYLLIIACNVIDWKYSVQWICMACHLWQEQTRKLLCMENWVDRNINSKTSLEAVTLAPEFCCLNKSSVSPPKVKNNLFLWNFAGLDDCLECLCNLHSSN